MQNQRQGKLKVVAGYALEQRLGSGSFATVYKGVKVPASVVSMTTNDNADDELRLPTPPDVVAIKAISRTSTKLTKKVLQNLEIEMSILRTYQHPNIVCMHEAHKTEKHFFLILEYCGGGDVQGLIRTRKSGRLTERLARRLMRDLASGLRFLWSQELIHRDIKPQNLLLSGALPLDENDDPEKTQEGEERRRRINFPSDQFRLKIADFGFARHLQTASLAETLCGSPLYMAPEILQHHRYDAKADLWSVGTVLFEMIAGHPPFNGENHIDLLRNIQTKPVRLPPTVQISNICVKLLRLLLNRNPLSRAGFKEFFECCADFVALGCEGVEVQSTGTRRVVAKDLGTIQEDDGGSNTACSDSMITTATNQVQFGGITSNQDENDITRMGESPSLPSKVASPMVRTVETIATNPATIPNYEKKITPLTQSPPSSSHITPQSSNTALVPPVDPPLRSHSWVQNQNHAGVAEKYDMSRSDDSGFVMVELGSESRKDTMEPSGVSVGTIGQRGYVPPQQPQPHPMYFLNSQSPIGKAVSSRIGVGERKGMLSTSPGTGGFLMGLYGRQRIGCDHTTQNDSNFGDQIAAASKMISAAEDVGRRAVSVAHLGDSRAYLGMRVKNSNEDDCSLQHTAPMEAEEGTCAVSEDYDYGEVMTVSRRRSSLSTDKGMVIAEEDEMPFAISPDAPAVSLPSRSNHSTHSKGNNSMVSIRNGGSKAEYQNVRSCLGEALSCYLKALKMLKSAVGATQRVGKDLEQISTQSGRSPTEYDIPNMRRRCEVTSTWLRGQFYGVLERAESANVEISKLQSNSEDKHSTNHTIVEELIYNHALASGRDGAVKQLLGQNEAARTCYRSAGLLVETLLMEAGIGDEDRKILEGYVDAFAYRINELDQAMLNQTRILGSSPTIPGERDSGIVGLIGPPTSIPSELGAPPPH